MTGEKKVLVSVLVVSVAAWLAFGYLTLWHVQNDIIGWAWFWGILALVPMAVAYEIMRRWNRG